MSVGVHIYEVRVISDEAPREGVKTVIDTVRKSGSALLLAGAFQFSCMMFRSDESSNPKAAGDFAKVKRELATAKDAYATSVAGDHPKYEKPTDKLLLNDKSSFQLTSTLCFYKTKVESTTGQGMPLNDAGGLGRARCPYSVLYTCILYRRPPPKAKAKWQTRRDVLFAEGSGHCSVRPWGLVRNRMASKLQAQAALYTRILKLEEGRGGPPARFPNLGPAQSRGKAVPGTAYGGVGG